MRWICLACGHVYEEAKGSPEHGIPAGTAFADLPEDWDCPFCGSDKQHFAPEEDE
jgi:rubredoxin